MHDAPITIQPQKLARQPFRLVSNISGLQTKRGPGALAGKVLDFSTAFQTRYKKRPGLLRGAGLIYHRTVLGRFVQRICRFTNFALAPRLQITFQTTLAQNRRLYPVQPPERVFPPLQESASHLPALPIPALKPAAILVWQTKGSDSIAVPDLHPLEIRRIVHETSWLSKRSDVQTVQRLLARLERSESVRRFARPTSHSSADPVLTNARFSQPVQTVLPVPRRMLNQGQAKLREESQPLDATTQNPVIRPSAWTSSPLETSVSPVSEVNIQQLADQVVQVIDDRVIAHRERMGRI